MSGESDPDVGENTPRQLKTYESSVEGKVDIAGEALRALRDEVREYRREQAHATGVLMRVEATVLAMSVRVARLDAEREVSVEAVRKSRAEMSELREAIRASAPPAPRRPTASRPNLDYDQMGDTERRAVLTQQDVDLALARERIKELEAESADKSERSRFWGRWAVGIVATIVAGVVVAVIVSRVNEPTMKQTTEIRERGAK